MLFVIISPPDNTKIRMLCLLSGINKTHPTIVVWMKSKKGEINQITVTPGPRMSTQTGGWPEISTFVEGLQLSEKYYQRLIE